MNNASHILHEVVCPFENDHMFSSQLSWIFNLTDIILGYFSTITGGCCVYLFVLLLVSFSALFSFITVQNLLYIE